jgi:myo-inositol-1(or 4)-monophosphatase
MMACVNIEAVLQDLIETVRAAGEVTQAHFARFREIDVEVKGPGDFVSDADRESETLIRDRLLSRYPGFSLSGEEFAPVDGSDPDYRFLVDPIDGTTSFLNGQHYTITIALRRAGETLCGVVYDPVADEMFTAVKGGGAFLNGERLLVSPSTEVRFMCIGTGLPTPNLSLHPGAYQRLDAIRAPIGAVRVPGSAALACVMVACGRLTGYFEETGFTDTAAGLLAVQEAGGVVTDWWGRGPTAYERTGALLVANRATHAFLLEQLKDVPMKNPDAGL